MPDPALPANLADLLRDIERRLRNLENSPQLVVTSIKDGTLQGLDSSGNVLVEFGKLGTDYGLRVKNSAGVAVFEANTTGLKYPAQPLPITYNNEFIDMTGAAFDHAFFSKLVSPYGNAIRVQFTVQSTTGADAGELRVQVYNSTGVVATSPVQTHAAGAYVRYRLDWQPGWTITNTTSDWALSIQARRTAGTGALRVVADHADLVDASIIGATPTGIWSLS